MSEFDDLASNASSRRSRASAIGAENANSSKQLNFPAPTTTKFFNKKFPIFPLLLTYKQTNLQIVSLLSMAVFALQHWAFMLNPHFSSLWGGILGNEISTIIYGVQLTFYDPALISGVTPTVNIGIAFALLVIVLVLLGCIFFHLRPMEDSTEGKGPTNTVARIALDVLSSVLLIPIFQACFASMICGSTGYMWMMQFYTSAKCWSSSHIIAFVPSLIVVLLLLPVLYIKIVCVYDYIPLSENFLAARYSIVDKLTFFHDVLSCLLFNLMVAWNLTAGYAIVHACTSATLVGCYVYFLPYFTMRVNRFYVLVHTIECIASIFISASSLSYPFWRDEMSSSLLLGAGAVVTILMVTVTDFRVNTRFYYAMKHTEQCTHIFMEGQDELDVSGGIDDEREALLFEDHVYKIDDAEVDRLPYPKGLITTNAFTQYGGLNKQVSESIARQQLNTLLDGGQGSEKKKTLQVVEAYLERVHVPLDACLSVGFLDLYARQFSVQQVSEMMLIFAANIFSKALVTFPDEPDILQAFTTFITTYLPGMSFMGVDLVKRTLRAPTTVEQQFRALKQEGELRAALGIRTHAHSIRSTKARTTHGRVLQSINKFWVKLTEPNVNMKEVSDIADDIRERRELTISQFDLALRHQQTADAVLLRRLGDFFTDVMMSPDAALECYNESRDVHEARQARSMRGTRQHVGEIDVVALSERMRHLLKYHKEGRSYTGSSKSSLMRRFMWLVCGYFILLDGCAAMFLYVMQLLTVDLGDVMDGTMACTQLRTEATRFGSIVTIYTMTEDPTIRAKMVAVLDQQIASFSSHFKFISSGNGRPHSPEGKFLLAEHTIPYYDKYSDNIKGFSLWSLSETYIQAMNTFLTPTNPVSGAISMSFLADATGVVASSYSSMLDLQHTKELAHRSVSWIAWSTGIFALAAICLTVTYVSVLFAFRRIAISRIFTFQLFTLIPYESLEKLATEAKERYHQIHLEKSFKQSASSGMDNDPNNKGEGRAQRQDGETRVKLHPTPYLPAALGDVPVKSCLKPAPPALSTGGGSTPHGPVQKKKRVQFNPIVEVVGGGGPEKKKQGRDKPADADADDDDDTDLLFLSTMSRKQATTTALTSSSGKQVALRGTLIYFFLMVICLIVLFVVLALLIEEQRNHKEIATQYTSLERKLASGCLHIVDIVHSTTRFIQNGEVLSFQDAQDSVSSLVQNIPLMSGMDFTQEATTNLVRMHSIATMIGNLTLDASALGAKVHGISLSYWSDIRYRDSLSTTELVAAMVAKYPVEHKVVTAIYNYLGAPLDDVQLLAYTIVMHSSVVYTQEYRKLFFTVMNELAQNDAQRLVLGDTYWIIALTISIVAVMASLVIAVTPLRGLLSMYLSLEHTLLTALAFAVIIGMSIGLMVSERNVGKIGSTASAGLRSLDTFLDNFLYTDENYGSFVFTAQPSLWFNAETVNVPNAIDSLGEVAILEYLSVNVSNQFTVVADEWSRMAKLYNISSALAISCFSGYMVVEAPMQKALDGTFWNLYSEPDHIVNQVLTPQDLYYTTKTNDMMLTPVDQFLTAVSVSAGTEYMKSLRRMSESVQTLYDLFITGEMNMIYAQLTRRSTLVYVTLGLCALPLAACVWMVGIASHAIREVLQLNTNGNSQSSSRDSARYDTMLRRVQYALIVVLIFFGATFGIGIWLTQAGFSFTAQMNLATQHEFEVSVSFYRFRQLLSLQPSYVTPSMITKSIDSLAIHLTEQFQGTSAIGVPRGLSLSNKVNSYVFGNATVDAQLLVATSYMTTNCSKYLSGDASPLPLFDIIDNDGNVTYTVSTNIYRWVDLMTRSIAIAENFATTTVDQMFIALNIFTPIATAILESISEASTTVKSALDDRHRVLTQIFLALAILTLVATMLVYFLVMVPTILHLFKEEESLRVLLQMIPLDIRDEVPAIAQYMETGEMSNAAEMRSQFEANEKLLQNILPHKIAARLKMGEQPIADTHSCVTMLFTDFVGFTKRSSTMQAREIVDFLNEVFLEFDTVVELLQVEKIKTIGDAFFMAGGLDPLITDHALRVVEAGLMFFEALEEHNRRHPTRVPLQMRLGVHSGPVVAGVIGIKKVAYDLWGDSVEIANAMESTGVPGYVHISENTAMFVRGFFQLEPRGELPREKEHIPDDMPATYLVVSRTLPTPYMHLRRPRLLPTNIRQM